MIDETRYEPGCDLADTTWHGQLIDRGRSLMTATSETGMQYSTRRLGAWFRAQRRTVPASYYRTRWVACEHSCRGPSSLLPHAVWPRKNRRVKVTVSRTWADAGYRVTRGGNVVQNQEVRRRLVPISYPKLPIVYSLYTL